jgi:hypothetical protein
MRAVAAGMGVSPGIFGHDWRWSDGGWGGYDDLKWDKMRAEDDYGYGGGGGGEDIGLGADEYL